MINNYKVKKEETRYTRKYEKSTAHSAHPQKPDRSGARRMRNITGHSRLSEKAIERYLCERCEAKGWLCLKYSNPNMAGYPDRLVVLPQNMVTWVELKSAGKKPSKLQEQRIARLREMGHIVRVIDNRPDIDRLTEELSDLIKMTDI